MNKPTKHIFVCTSSRMTGVAKGFCHTKGAIEIIQRFTEKLEEEDITDVTVSNTGCFGICEKGPIVTKIEAEKKIISKNKDQLLNDQKINKIYELYRTYFKNNKRNKGFVMNLAIAATIFAILALLAVIFYGIEKISEA